MPIYEYVCEKCGNRFELLQKNVASEGPNCPGCGAADAKKQLSSFSSASCSSSNSHSGG